LTTFTSPFKYACCDTETEKRKPDMSHFSVAIRPIIKKPFTLMLWKTSENKNGTGSCYCSQQTFLDHLTERGMTSPQMILRIRKL